MDGEPAEADAVAEETRESEVAVSSRSDAAAASAEDFLLPVMSTSSKAEKKAEEAPLEILTGPGELDDFLADVEISTAADEASEMPSELPSSSTLDSSARASVSELLEREALLCPTQLHSEPFDMGGEQMFLAKSGNLYGGSGDLKGILKDLDDLNLGQLCRDPSTSVEFGLADEEAQSKQFRESAALEDALADAADESGLASIEDCQAWLSNFRSNFDGPGSAPALYAATKRVKDPHHLHMDRMLNPELNYGQEDNDSHQQVRAASCDVMAKLDSPDSSTVDEDAGPGHSLHINLRNTAAGILTRFAAQAAAAAAYEKEAAAGALTPVSEASEQEAASAERSGAPSGRRKSRSSAKAGGPGLQTMTPLESHDAVRSACAEVFMKLDLLCQSNASVQAAQQRQQEKEHTQKEEHTQKAKQVDEDENDHDGLPETPSMTLERTFKASQTNAFADLYQLRPSGSVLRSQRRSMMQHSRSGALSEISCASGCSVVSLAGSTRRSQQLAEALLRMTETVKKPSPKLRKKMKMNQQHQIVHDSGAEAARLREECEAYKAKAKALWQEVQTLQQAVQEAKTRVAEKRASEMGNAAAKGKSKGKSGTISRAACIETASPNADTLRCPAAAEEAAFFQDDLSMSALPEEEQEEESDEFAETDVCSLRSGDACSTLLPQGFASSTLGLGRLPHGMVFSKRDKDDVQSQCSTDLPASFAVPGSRRSSCASSLLPY
eukprot:TRINITY_DN11002_c0_g1_i1.p1 TRINITY_DN11002_c0_g1~~TRINITY_DN11002_c0_g1_i1.p1  ORF type:complete len:725 (+),score=237.12 TRINITY_DN11002_c0_g1_i1:114-2288(+)